MAGSQTGAFGAGVQHATASGRANDQSITLGGSLQADSDRWAAMTPHSVIQSTPGGGPGFEAVQRLTGTSQPGGLGRFEDELSGGSDNYNAGEE